MPGYLGNDPDQQRKLPDKLIPQVERQQPTLPSLRGMMLGI